MLDEPSVSLYDVTGSAVRALLVNFSIHWMDIKATEMERRLKSKSNLLDLSSLRERERGGGETDNIGKVRD